MTSFRFTSALCGCLTLMLVTIAGCGGAAGDPCSATGTVKFANAPVKKGMILFIETEAAGRKRTQVSGEIVDGKFNIPEDKGLIAGEYQVRITAMRKLKKPKKGFEGEPVDVEGKDGTAGLEDEEQYIPDRYNVSTKLTATLKAGENTGGDLDFKLTAD